MSQKITAQNGPTITLEEAVAGALRGKEDLLVSLDAHGKAVLFDGTAPAIGVYVSRLDPESTALEIRLLNAGGTVRVIQGVAIAPGSRVAGVAASARVAVASAPGRSLGFKLAPDSAGAAGDVIEIIPSVETLETPE
jgi:hypothetical protein